MSPLDPRRGETGAALAFVVLLMLALLALAHGGLVAALAELAGSRAAARDLRLRGAATYALSEAMGRRPGPWMDSLGVGETDTLALGPVGGVSTEGAVRRLGAESWLVEGTAATPEGITARILRLAWAVDPVLRVTALGGAVTVATGAPVLLAGAVDASDPVTPLAPMLPTDCDPWRVALEEHYVGTPLAGVAALPGTGTVGLGLLDFERLLAAAPVQVSYAGTPAPAESAGVCLTADPWGWGDPDQPWRPCGGYLPMRASDGDLRVEGGVGQGLLVVRGDLRLEAGARLYGMVIATGALSLAGGSTFEGIAVAAGGVEVGAGSGLRASACWAVRALAAQRGALGGFLPVDEPLGPL